MGVDVSRYLAEVYVPDALGFGEISEQIRSAVDVASRTGDPVRHLRSIFVPADQTCLLLFDARSPTSVQHVARRAHLQVTRVVEAIEAASSEEKDPEGSG